MVSMRLAGIIGLVLTGALLSVSSWRLVFHSWGCLSCCGFRDDRVSRGITMRRAFHVLLWIAMFCQVLAYGDLAFGNSQDRGFFTMKLGYTLLNIIGRSIFEYTAFSVVTVVWFKSTARARAGASETKKAFRIFPAVLAASVLVLVSTSIWEAIELLSTRGFDDLETFIQGSKVYRSQLMVQACCWSIHGLLIIICGGMMYKRLRRLPQWKRLRRKKKAFILARIYTIMVLCALCYFLRAAFLVVDYVGYLETWVMFWVGSVWVPSTVPSVLLLYALRRRDRVPGYIEGVPEAPLLPHPAPPEEMFDTFKKSIYDANDSYDDIDLEVPDRDNSSTIDVSAGDCFCDYESSEDSLVFT